MFKYKQGLVRNTVIRPNKCHIIDRFKNPISFTRNKIDKFIYAKLDNYNQASPWKAIIPSDRASIQKSYWNDLLHMSALVIIAVSHIYIYSLLNRVCIQQRHSPMCVIVSGCRCMCMCVCLALRVCMTGDPANCRWLPMNRSKHMWSVPFNNHQWRHVCKTEIATPKP